MRMGRGIRMTPASMRICMQTIYEERKKLKNMRRPKSQEHPEVYSVVFVLCDHQACSFVRTYEREGSRQ